MIKLKTKELHFDEELKKKIEFICDFCIQNLLLLMGIFAILLEQI